MKIGGHDTFRRILLEQARGDAEELYERLKARTLLPRPIAASGTTITVAWEDVPPLAAGDYVFPRPPRRRRKSRKR